MFGFFRKRSKSYEELIRIPDQKAFEAAFGLRESSDINGLLIEMADHQAEYDTIAKFREFTHNTSPEPAGNTLLRKLFCPATLAETKAVLVSVRETTGGDLILDAVRCKASMDWALLHSAQSPV